MDVVLVLADPDALRIDLDQLGERVLQPARDADRAAHGEIQLRELLTGNVARRVDTRTRLAHRHTERPVLGQPLGGQQLAHEALGLAPVRTVADSNRARPMLAAKGSQSTSRAFERRLALDQIDDRMLEQLPGLVDHRDLAAGALPRVDAEDRLGAERRRQQ